MIIINGEPSDLAPGATLSELLAHVDAPDRGDALDLDQQRRELVLGHPDDGELGGDLAAQRLEGAQQDRQPLALDRLADELERAAR